MRQNMAFKAKSLASSSSHSKKKSLYEGNDLPSIHPTALDIIGESGELVLSAASPSPG